MKKFIIFAVALALLVPSMALAAAEFSLGGFVKMDMMWDSDSGVGKNMNLLPSRNNANGPKHGKMKFTAQGSRFNFTIKGPKLWGATTTGFIEMDFDTAENGVANIALNGASKSYTPRLRHAMFRFNWPTSELLLGQYFSMFSEWYAESAEDGPLQMTGTPTARMAQIRFTQKFMQDWTVAALIGDANSAGLNGTFYNVNTNNGQSAETPQVQGKIQYAHDFWGKAAYYGKPIPFTIQFVGGWQRNVMRNTAPVTGLAPFAAATFGEQGGVGWAVNNKNQYLNPWLAMGSLFIPVIPTHTANLAGTASILTQWWIGQGVEAFGFTGTFGSKYRFDSRNTIAGTWNYDAELLNKFGGFVEGQYYFTNQWFVNALYGISKAFNVSRSPVRVFGANIPEVGLESVNEPQTIQQMSATLWYRPIQAIKFGLQYSYLAAHYYQMNTTPGFTSNSTNFGDNHRVEFVGFFYF